MLLIIVRVNSMRRDLIICLVHVFNNGCVQQEIWRYLHNYKSYILVGIWVEKLFVKLI